MLFYFMHSGLGKFRLINNNTCRKQVSRLQNLSGTFRNYQVIWIQQKHNLVDIKYENKTRKLGLIILNGLKIEHCNHLNNAVTKVGSNSHSPAIHQVTLGFPIMNVGLILKIANSYQIF